MSKPFFVVLIALVALLGGQRHFSAGQEPAKAEKANDRSEP